MNFKSLSRAHAHTRKWPAAGKTPRVINQSSACSTYRRLIMEENPEKAEAGKGEAGNEEEEMEESPAHSSSESENDSDGDGLAAFMWGRRYTYSL